VTRQHKGGGLWFAAWGAAGFLFGFAGIAILSIGMFVLPLAMALTFVVYKQARGWPEGLGFLAGLALPLVYLLAWMATA
jgi:hypothetical protein